MRNLRNIRFSTWKPPNGITAACWDASSDDIVCTLGPSPQNAEIELWRISDRMDGMSHRKIVSWDAPIPTPDITVDRILSIHHFADGSATTCIVLEGGDIYVVREDGDASYGDDAAPCHIEIVGSVDTGIAAARWSPDGELLAIATKARTVVCMSRTFDGVAEVAMASEDLGLSKQVSVGWGKKETQFQGKGAKALRDPTIPEKVDQGVLSPSDDGSTSISWRGDGAYFAVNSIEPGKRRVIRVYSREGDLDGVSEPVDGLEGALSWRPAGNLMAAIQRLPDRVDVVFFERNGLRHGQFTLPPDTNGNPLDLPNSSFKLEWNSDSTVLAVTYGNKTQLWTMGNYHWYLKQEISSHSSGLPCWHPEKPLRLAIAGSSGLFIMEYAFAIARGSLKPPHDYGAVAVVDGQTLKLTPFRTVNMPPPMAMFEIPVPSPIKDVAFGPNNEYLAILHDDGLDIYAWQSKGLRSAHPKLVTRSRLLHDEHPRENGLVQYLQVALASRGHFHVLVFIDDDLEILSYEADLVSQEPVIQLKSTTKLESSQRVLFSDSESYTLNAAGQVDGLGDPGSDFASAKFPTLVPWVEIAEAEGRRIPVGLTRGGALYADSKQLAKNCTSFLVTPAHIVFTTSNHFVKFIHLTSGELEAPLDDPENDERCRSIERGAKLVTAIPTNMSLILQMPRGNLETIYPRAMVVASIRDAINEKDYKRAFSHCRTQRVDMNILYDHNPKQFLSCVELFLDQLQDVTSIDLFLSSLRDEDVTRTMYKNTNPSSGGQQVDDVASGPVQKVNAICDAVLKALETRKATNLQNIITANVSKVPPALDDGLLVVAQLMEEDNSIAEQAAEHICFLVDVNRLFDHALGLYDLQLALLIAQQSQRDPREYVPFVQSLHELPDLRRKYTIDDHLGRREKALQHLKALDAFDELKGYVVKYSLYMPALELYRYDSTRNSELTDLHAQYLESKSKFRDAALAYESLSNFAKAASCYRAAGPSFWREALFAAQQQDPPPSDEMMTDLASALADALTEAKDHAAAAEIHMDYLHTPGQAVRSLCKGYHFAAALLLSSRLRQPDLLQIVDTGLGDGLASSTELLADCKSQLAAQVPRILELRERAKADPLAFYEGELPGGGDLPDDISVAASSRVSTSASLFTRYTGKGGSVGTVGTGVSRRTTKNKRREEKKRARGRKGTVYEEEYLVNSVRRLVERVEGSARSEVQRLVEGLVRRGMSERARAVEGLMSEVVDHCQRAIDEVWGKEELTQEVQVQEEAGEEGYRPQGGDAVLADFIEERWKKQVPPVIKKFERLGLLG